MSALRSAVPRTFALGAVCGLVSAALFGASTPLSKWLLPSAPPVLLAALLYLGAGVGMTLIGLARRTTGKMPPHRRLQRPDLPLLIGIIVTGGVVGPVLMLTGLQHVTGTVGSLLLNLEGPFTALLAVVFFADALSRWETIAASLIFGGAVIVTGSSHGTPAGWLGGAAIAAACLSWGIDNNLTQRVSSRDPTTIVQVKTLSAGLCNLILAVVLGQRLTSWRLAVPILAIGFVCYGLSILLDVYALRLLGAAREAAFFATAPFMGVLLAVPLLHERLRATDWLGATVMIAGVIILVRRRAAS